MLGLAQLFAVGALDRRAALLFDLVERTFTMGGGGFFFWRICMMWTKDDAE